MPYQSDPVSRAKINAGRMDYLDVHLSHVAQMVWQGFFGHLDVALVEVAGITDDGDADPVLLGRQQQDVDRPGRKGHPRGQLLAADRTGGHARHLLRHRAAPGTASRSRSCGPPTGSACPIFRCPPEKIVAVVPTHSPDRNSPFKPPDTVSGLIAGQVVDFLSARGEARAGCRATLLPLQSGVGNIANAVLAGLDDGPFRPLTAYTEVIQDGMLHMLRSGTMSIASATAFSLSEDGIARTAWTTSATTATRSSCARRRSATTPR